MSLLDDTINFRAELDYGITENNELFSLNAISKKMRTYTYNGSYISRPVTDNNNLCLLETQLIHYDDTANIRWINKYIDDWYTKIAWFLVGENVDVAYVYDHGSAIVIKKTGAFSPEFIVYHNNTDIIEKLVINSETSLNGMIHIPNEGFVIRDALRYTHDSVGLIEISTSDKYHEIMYVTKDMRHMTQKLRQIYAPKKIHRDAYIDIWVIVQN